MQQAQKGRIHDHQKVYDISKPNLIKVPEWSLKPSGQLHEDVVIQQGKSVQGSYDTCRRGKNYAAISKRNEDDTITLPNIWGQTETLRRFRETGKNRPIWKCVCRKLEDNGFSRTWERCQSRVHNFESL